jgi:putative tricarboxylic transport membrane protein
MKHLNFKNDFLSFMMIVSLLLVLAATASSANPADDFPTQPIQYVTHVGPGGPNDLMGRIMQKIIKEEKIFSQPLTVLNKQGGQGAVAMGYVFERRGNPHVVYVSTSGTFLSTPLLENLPYNFKNFTPICNFLADGSIVAVRAASPFLTIDDLMAEARKRPKTLNQAGSSFTGSQNMMGRAIQKLKGLQWNFISFNSETEATLAVLGGNADFQIGNPIAIMEHVKAGKLRVLLTAAPFRYAEFDVPTIKEVGLGDAISTYRGIVAPPGIPEYAAKKLEAAFKKIFENEQFKKYMADSMAQPFWMSSKEYAKFLEEESVRTKERLDDLGLLKKK